MFPLNDRYKIRFEDIPIGNLQLNMALIENVDALMEELLKKDLSDPDVADERIPYWAELWPSAIALASFLESQQIIRPGMRVLEIGCGFGLPGLVAAKLGAEVIMTDYMHEALEFSRFNFERNEVFSAKFHTYDWRQPYPSDPPDLVLASDIAYEQKSFDAIKNAFLTLSRPGTVILTTEPNRAYSREFYASVDPACFEHRQETRQLLFREHLYQVHVHRLQRVY